jgi:hypothetical protein
MARRATKNVDREETKLILVEAKEIPLGRSAAAA